MIKNYLLAAVRNFRKNSIVSIINLLGLSIGLATCLVAGLYCSHELAADQFHRDIDKIYRTSIQMRQYSITGTPYLFNETIQKDFPFVEETLRSSEINTTVRIDQETFNNKIILSDSNFFQFFTFDLSYGNPASSLKDIKNIVISEGIYERYFAGQNPLGQLIKLKLNNTFVDFQISGVWKKPSTYSSVQFDFLIPLENLFIHRPRADRTWNDFFMNSFLKVSPARLAELEAGIPDFVGRNISGARSSDGSISMNFVFKPLSKHHLSEGFSGGGLVEGRSASGLYIFGGISIVILILACFNFMNLTNAQASKRALEVGVRKVVGAGKAQLIRQFLVESICISIVASLLALGIAELSLLAFRDLFQVQLTVFNLSKWEIFSGLAATTILTGVLAGVYPAFVLSNISALSTFRRIMTVNGSNWITRTVLSLQFCISIVLIICALVMWKQQSFMMNKNLGFNQEHLLVIPFKPADTASIPVMKNRTGEFPEVLNVSHASGVFTRGNSATIQKMPDGSELFIYFASVDAHYLETMQLELVKGSDFPKNTVIPKNHIIINETLMKQLNLEDSIGVPLGRTIAAVDNPTVIGVVKDFHHAQLKHEIGPLVFMANHHMHESFLIMRLEKNKLAEGLSKARQLWIETNPNSPFEYFFLDDDVRKQYDQERRWSLIISIATGMAIFLSVLGLLALAMFTAEQRKKEIGIRKVMGASLQQLMTLLSKDYLLLVLLSFVLAAPVAYYIMMNYWLKDFVYRIQIDVVVFVTALLAVMIIAAIAIGSQMIRAALQNPVDTLKEQ